MPMDEHTAINGRRGSVADHSTDSDVEERHHMEMQHQAGQSNREQQRRDVSALLGEKMLQGWTLLGDQCPRYELMHAS